MKFNDWIEEKKLSLFSKEKSIIILNGIDGTFQIVERKDILIDEIGRLILSEEEQKNHPTFYIFEWGGKWYYEKFDYEKVTFQLFEDLGNIQDNLFIDDYPFLGIHGHHELYNGTGTYNAWMERLKFMKYGIAAIVEKNTLGGILSFQRECSNFGIKSIIGEEVVVEQSDGFQYHVKLYVKNEKGWDILLLINKEINVINERSFIREDRFFELIRFDLIVVLDKWIRLSDSLINKYNTAVGRDNLFYQLDTVIYKNDVRDIELLNLQKQNLNFVDAIKFVLVNDAYYINKSDFEIKKKLNEINPRGEVQEVALNQHIKNLDDNFAVFHTLFKEDDNRLWLILETSINNAIKIGSECNFIYAGRGMHLPKFKRNHLDLTSIIKSNDDLIWELIEQGIRIKLKDKTNDELSIYFERIDIEMDIILKGGFVDYFLILWDIIYFANKNGILTAPGRGSSAGSLIAYLLNITNIDPIEYDLLFERFLNQGRLDSGEPPDIDTDFAGSRRDEIKKYLEGLYGSEQVCSVGTYGTFQLASAVKDMLRGRVEPQTLNYIIKRATFETGEFYDLFLEAIHNKQLRGLLKLWPSQINKAQVIHKQVKMTSIHPSAFIITPEENGNIFSQFPVRKEGDMLISEWDGEELADLGFLKEDLLGTKQLDKFADIMKLIQQFRGETVDFYNIPLDDEAVYDYYKKGLNADNFHFGSNLLTIYSRKILPDNIDDLTAMIALVRPGTLEVGTTERYVKLKNKEIKIDYMPGTEEITKSTFGLIVYQEQVMQICQSMGNFTLTEADKIRKAMGKIKEEILVPFKEKFIENAIKNGYEENNVEQIWHLMAEHAKYSFNKSHSVSYAIIGYISQWFKVNYPIEFWLTAFEYADKDDIVRYVSEINNTKKVTIKQANINFTEVDFSVDLEKNELYWSISQIQGIGDSRLKELNEEKKNGAYISYKDFLYRIKENGRKLGKQVIENLIFAGAFDEIESVKKTSDRHQLMIELIEGFGIKEKELFINKKEYYLEKDWWWSLQQRRVSNFAYFDYFNIIFSEMPELENRKSKFADGFGINAGAYDHKIIISAGIVIEVKEGSSINGDYGSVRIDSNFEEIVLTLWNEAWAVFKEEIKEDTILVFSGKCTYSEYQKGYGITISKKSICKTLEDERHD